MKRSLGAKTLVFPTPVWVIGTYDDKGRPNAMTASWAGVCCSQPPCVAVSLRTHRYTYDAVVARRAFTVNVPSTTYVREADFLGIASGRNVDKFAVTGLTAVASELVDAPFIAEFPLSLECRVLQVVEIGSHTQFIGEILDVKADEAVLDESGAPSVERVAPFVYGPEVHAYHGVGALLGKAYTLGRDLE